MATLNACANGLSGTTGTGSYVGSSSPTLITPILGTPTSGTLTNCSGYVPSNLSSITGTGAAVLGTSPTITTPVINGVTNGSSAAAGVVGQVISSVVNPTPGVALTTTTGANVTSITLTAGDWDITGQVDFLPAGTTTISDIACSISLTSATLGSTYSLNESYSQTITTFATGANQCLPLATCTASVSGSTTYYLVAQANFAISTLAAGGKIIARRVR